MGYPNFGKVKTLTLPIPDSSMTFAEYKNAYGIDLEQLENTALILLRESNEDIAPVLYYDKENAILYTANYSVDISAGFEVKTDSLISKVIAGGTIENAKPLYYHPIVITSNIASGTEGLSFSVIILNNDPAPINTWDKFIAWSEALADAVGGDALINCSGFYNDGVNEITSVAYLVCVSGDKSWRIRGGTYNNPQAVQVSLAKTDFANLPVISVVDGVNKIN